MKKLRHFLPTIGASVGVLAFAAAAAAAPGLVTAQENTDVDAPPAAALEHANEAALGTSPAVDPTDVPLPEIVPSDVKLPDVVPSDVDLPEPPVKTTDGDDDEGKPSKTEAEGGKSAANHGACVSYWAHQAKRAGLKAKGSFISPIAGDPAAVMVRGAEPSKKNGCDFGKQLKQALKAQAAEDDGPAATGKDDGEKPDKSGPKPQKSHAPDGDEESDK